MNKSNSLDTLSETLQICKLHHKRMKYAFDKIEKHFPLNEDEYKKLSPDALSYLDQLIFRFSKLQDAMGERLFPSLLENLGEDISGKPFIDLLTKLEKLNLLKDYKQWLITSRNT